MIAEWRLVRASLLVLVSLLCSGNANADGDMTVRPQLGVGVLDGKSYQHVGARWLLGANDKQKYGLELSRLNTSQGDYLAAGIVLEQRKFGWFNMSIGSIGYFGQGGSVQNVPGLISNLGWEPVTTDTIKPFVTLRNDVMFGSKTKAGYALSAGLSLTY
jgi:hypothetical protein